MKIKNFHAQENQSFSGPENQRKNERVFLAFKFQRNKQRNSNIMETKFYGDKNDRK